MPAAEYGATPQEQAQKQQEYMTPDYWAKEFAAARKWFQRWHARARTIERKYKLQDQDAEANPGRFPLFWSNVQTALATAYGQVPKVSVDRQNFDSRDDVARVAALILERIFNFEADDLEESPYYVFQDAILDRLVPGLGVAWARYEFDSEQRMLSPDVLDPNTGQPVTIEVITDERAPLDYVRWDDFLFSPCKRWQDKRWVARRVPMTQDMLNKRFGPKAVGVPMALKGAPTRAKHDDDPLRAITEEMADVWEIWCGTTKSVHWYVQGASELLDNKQDPLQLKTFYPCQRPLIANILTNAYLPTPDYDYARSQYDELDIIAVRTKLLTEALKLVGVYDKQAEGVQRMLNQATMNQLIPVDNWAMFAEKGGIKGQVDWMPLDMVVTTLQYLTERRATLSTEVFELLGISDIQRGMASTTETATTQRLKAQFGSARSNKMQTEIARFVTDNYRMRGEIICKHWQPETIMRVSQIDKTPDAPLAQQAVALMKQDPTVAMRVKISAENITAPDWELEKAQRVDFLSSISGFITAAYPMAEKFPSTGKFLIETVQWVASGFKAGKQIEGVLDQALQGIQSDMAKPKETPPPTAQDKKDLASAQQSHAAAQKALVEATKALVEIGFDPMTAMQMATMLPPKYDPATPPAPPQGTAPLPGAGAPQPGAAAAPPNGPPAPGGAGGVPMAQGGAPPRPPMPMPSVPGMGPMQ